MSESRLAGELDARAAVECRSSAMAAAATGRGAREYCAVGSRFLFADELVRTVAFAARDRGELWQSRRRAGPVWIAGQAEPAAKMG